jgi:hypothetical protein
VESKRDTIRRVKYWEIIADNLKKRGWSLGWVSAIDANGRTIWIIDAHRVIRCSAPTDARLRRRQALQYWAPVVVNVMGILTFETDPGLNRHCRKALSAALSNIGFPILDAIEALVTLPLPASTSTTHTPLPVIRRERAS